MLLDYSLKTPAERIACVNQILEETPSDQISKQYLSYMSDYILFTIDKQQTKKERKDKEYPITTKNREVTIDKRQVSLEELISSLPNGEDGLHNLIMNDKNQILDPKDCITQEDIDEIPGLQEQLNLISSLQHQFQNAHGQIKFSLKRQIIETWQQIYILKASFRGTPVKGRLNNQVKNMAHMALDEHITYDPVTQLPQSDGLISLLNPAHISFLLCHYSQLKQECCDDLLSDMFHILLDLEELAEKTLRQAHPFLWDLLVWKIDGYTNQEIKEMMEEKHGEVHSEQYFSSLWRKRIPRLLVEQAQKDWLIWHFTNEEYGKWKYCSKCGEYKLAHPLFFARNTSKDGFYSRCKQCKTAKE